MGFFYRIGRFFQVVGLFVSLIGVAGNLARPADVSVKQSMYIAAIGITIFFVGWLIQGKVPPR